VYLVLQKLNQISVIVARLEALTTIVSCKEDLMFSLGRWEQSKHQFKSTLLTELLFFKVKPLSAGLIVIQRDFWKRKPSAIWTLSWNNWILN